MKKVFKTKDSGKRMTYKSGLVRESLDGKTDYTLVDRKMLKRWAELLTRGAQKYGKTSWHKADSQEELERFQSSAFRHFIQWMDGEDDEDHAAAVFFNISAVEMVKSKLEKKKKNKK